jgi:hypothetical protein
MQPDLPIPDADPTPAAHVVLDLQPVNYLVPSTNNDDERASLNELLQSATCIRRDLSTELTFDIDRLAHFLSRNEPTLQRAALQLLAHTAEWDEANFDRFLTLTFPLVNDLLSSPNADVQWAALYVTKFCINSSPNIEPILSALTRVIRHLNSPEPDVQLAALEVLQYCAQSSRYVIHYPAVTI